jgi:hypothetical protein
LVLSVVITIFIAMMEINSIGQGGPSLWKIKNNLNVKTLH